MYQGSLAYQLDGSQNAWEAPERSSYTLLQGGNRDALVRQDATSALSAFVKVALTLAVVFTVLGCVRVALTAETVNLLRDINVAESTVKRARETRTELSVERSALSSTDRIQRIATENYDMVYATDVDIISVTEDEMADEFDGESEGDPGFIDDMLDAFDADSEASLA
jgi:cell division protein FtsL